MSLASKLGMLLTAAIFSGEAAAALYDRGNGMVYESTQNITWLKDWNTSGSAYYPAASAWATNLTHGGYSDWTLPTIGQYYTLWTEVGNALWTGGTPFTNVQPNAYWSSTDYAPNPRYQWVFNSNYAIVGYGTESVDLWAVAVRPGDVAAVPEPSTLALMALGVAFCLCRRAYQITHKPLR